MSWWLAGLIAGVGAWLGDYVMWGKVFTKGMDAYVTPPPAGQPVAMGGMMAKSATLSLLHGLVLAFVYAKFVGALWVAGGGPLAGWEFGAVLWLCTAAFGTVSSGVWFDKVRPLLKATFVSSFVRLSVAGILIGLLLK